MYKLKACAHIPSSPRLFRYTIVIPNGPTTITSPKEVSISIASSISPRHQASIVAGPSTQLVCVRSSGECAGGFASNFPAAVNAISPKRSRNSCIRRAKVDTGSAAAGQSRRVSAAAAETQTPATHQLMRRGRGTSNFGPKIRRRHSDDQLARYFAKTVFIRFLTPSFSYESYVLTELLRYLVKFVLVIRILAETAVISLRFSSRLFFFSLFFPLTICFLYYTSGKSNIFIVCHDFDQCV